MSSGFPPQPSNSQPSNPQPSNPFQAPPSALPPQRRNSLLWVIGIGLVASMCLCGGPCVALVGVGVYQVATQRDDVERAIDAGMQGIAAHDIDEALTHWSKRAINNEFVTREKLEKLADAPEFSEYEAVHIASIQINASYNSNAKLPQGTVANVSGTIDYRDGKKGTFQATLEKENGQWRLFSMRVNRSDGGATVGPTTPEAN